MPNSDYAAGAGSGAKHCPERIVHVEQLPFAKPMKSKRSDVVACLLLVLCALASAITGLGQDHPGVVELSSRGCEIDEANFNVVRVAALEGLGENSFLIAVACLGSRDKARDINRWR